MYTDPETGIVFNTWSATDGPIQGEGYGSVSLGGFTFGMALPSDALTVDANEFIGYLVSRPRQHASFWSNIPDSCFGLGNIDDAYSAMPPHTCRNALLRLPPVKDGVASRWVVP